MTGCFNLCIIEISSHHSAAIAAAPSARLLLVSLYYRKAGKKSLYKTDDFLGQAYEEILSDNFLPHHLPK